MKVRADAPVNASSAHRLTLPSLLISTAATTWRKTAIPTSHPVRNELHSPANQPGLASSASSAPPSGSRTTSTPVKRACAVAARSSPAEPGLLLHLPRGLTQQARQVAAGAALEQAGGYDRVEPGRADTRPHGLEGDIGGRARRKLALGAAQLVAGGAAEGAGRLPEGAAERVAAGEGVGEGERERGQLGVDGAAIALAARAQEAGDRPGPSGGEREARRSGRPAAQPAPSARAAPTSRSRRRSTTPGSRPSRPSVTTASTRPARPRTAPAPLETTPGPRRSQAARAAVAPAMAARPVAAVTGRRSWCAFGVALRSLRAPRCPAGLERQQSRVRAPSALAAGECGPSDAPYA